MVDGWAVGVGVGGGVAMWGGGLRVESNARAVDLVTHAVHTHIHIHTHTHTHTHTDSAIAAGNLWRQLETCVSFLESYIYIHICSKGHASFSC